MILLKIRRERKVLTLFKFTELEEGRYMIILGLYSHFSDLKVNQMVIYPWPRVRKYELPYFSFALNMLWHPDEYGPKEFLIPRSGRTYDQPFYWVRDQYIITSKY